MTSHQTTHVPASSLTIAALGIVFGDIGTSPLYALTESLHYLPKNTGSLSVFALLSLVFWAFAINISLKYISVILRADNQGEGGVLALLSLLKRYHQKRFGAFLILSMFGAGLLFGDGILTPAISVLSAVEGLSLVSPHSKLMSCH